MKNIKRPLAFLFLSGLLVLEAAPAWAVEGIIYKAEAASGNYCHLKFPAIQERTLYFGRPVLKDVSEGDIVDFYGPCDYDPLGQQEVMRQRRDQVRERERNRD